MRFQAYHLQQLVDPPAQLRALHSVDAPEKLDVLRRGKRRIKRYFLRRKTSHLANQVRFLARAMTEQRRISARRPPLSREHRNRRGFARSVGSQQAENFSFVNLEIQSADGGGRAVTLAQADHAQRDSLLLRWRMPNKWNAGFSIFCEAIGSHIRGSPDS